MGSIEKINDLIYDIFEELNTLKKSIETDINYSSEHADVVQYVEESEELLEEFKKQIKDAHQDLETLNEEIQEKSNNPYEEQDDYED